MTTNNANGTMEDVSHTNPYTGESMGSVFEHGVTIVADGGRDPEREGEEAETNPDGTPMKEVDHTPPHDDGEGTDRVFERGGEGVPEETEE